MCTKIRAFLAPLTFWRYSTRLVRTTQVFGVFFVSSVCFAASATFDQSLNPIVEAPIADLLHAYADAVKNDPVFSQQLATYLASEQATPLARSALLPQLSATGAVAGTMQTTRLSGYNRFDSSNLSLNMSQAVFNFSAFQQLRQAKLSVQAAAVLLSSQAQDLMVRVVNAYLEVLRTRDILRYTNQQRHFGQKFYQMMHERYKLKHATITDMEQAKGQYDLFRSQYTSAKINFFRAMQDLSAITGVRYRRVSTFKRPVHFTRPTPLKKMNAWVKLAIHQNLAFRAAQFEMLAARSQVTAIKGGFFPTLNAIATYSDQNQISSLVQGALPENVRTGVVGLNLDWPIIQGGQTIARLRQTAATYRESVATMKQRYFRAIVATRSAYVGVFDGVVRVRDSREAMQTNFSGLMHAEESFRSGIQSIYDLLQSQTRLFTSQRQYVEDFYNYFIDLIALKQSAGTLNPMDLYKLNQLLHPRLPRRKIKRICSACYNALRG